MMFLLFNELDRLLDIYRGEAVFEHAVYYS
jgi:hypothetical protein